MFTRALETQSLQQYQDQLMFYTQKYHGFVPSPATDFLGGGFLASTTGVYY